MGTHTIPTAHTSLAVDVIGCRLRLATQLKINDSQINDMAHAIISWLFSGWMVMNLSKVSLMAKGVGAWPPCNPVSLILNVNPRYLLVCHRTET